MSNTFVTVFKNTAVHCSDQNH